MSVNLDNKTIYIGPLNPIDGECRVYGDMNYGLEQKEFHVTERFCINCYSERGCYVTYDFTVTDKL